MFFAKLKWTYTINEFRDFRKFKNYNSRYQNQYAKKFSSEKQERQPTEDDQCYNCGLKDILAGTTRVEIYLKPK